MSKAATDIVKGSLAASIFFFLCVIIRPAGLAANDGLSYFGGFKTTIIPYSAALFVNAYFYAEAAKKLTHNHVVRNYMAYALRVMAVLLIGLVLTPHTLVDPIHTAIGTTLFSFQLLLSLWLLIKTGFDWINIGLVIMELAGGLVSFYYLSKPRGLLLQGQVLFQLGFGILIYKIVHKVAD